MVFQLVELLAVMVVYCLAVDQTVAQMVIVKVDSMGMKKAVS